MFTFDKFVREEVVRVKVLGEAVTYGEDEFVNLLV